MTFAPCILKIQHFCTTEWLTLAVSLSDTFSLPIISYRRRAVSQSVCQFDKILISRQRKCIYATLTFISHPEFF